MLVVAAHTAFEDRKVTLDRVGVYVTASIFKRAMLYRFMRGEVIADHRVQFGFVGMQAAFVVDVVAHDLCDRCTIGAGDMERAHVASAFNEGNNRALV